MFSHHDVSSPIEEAEEETTTSIELLSWLSASGMSGRAGGRARFQILAFRARVSKSEDIEESVMRFCSARPSVSCFTSAFAVLDQDDRVKCDTLLH